MAFVAPRSLRQVMRGCARRDFMHGEASAGTATNAEDKNRARLARNESMLVSSQNKTFRNGFSGILSELKILRKSSHST
jgi:hypothetical protein